MTSDINIKDFSSRVKERLLAVYTEGEAASLTRIIMEEMLHLSPVDMVLRKDEDVSPFMQGKVGEVVDRLLRHEPVQYIFGKTVFCGLELKVTPQVLIPRPETEELVDMIVKEWGGAADLRVLDACTGSGCIAVALARSLRFPVIDAVDISAGALDVARENASSLHVSVTFRQDDVLHIAPPVAPLYNIIVSNPPYIAESERSSMEPNVLDYEPEQALFVPDGNPLVFYRAIVTYAAKALLPGGRLYFEINPHYAASLAELLRGEGLADVELLRDMYGRQRFAVAASPLDND